MTDLHAEAAPEQATARLVRRAYEQLAIDAKAEAILAEERRLACVDRTAPSPRDLAPWSAV